LNNRQDDDEAVLRIAKLVREDMERRKSEGFLPSSTPPPTRPSVSAAQLTNTEELDGLRQKLTKSFEVIRGDPRLTEAVVGQIAPWLSPAPSPPPPPPDRLGGKWGMFLGLFTLVGLLATAVAYAVSP